MIIRVSVLEGGDAERVRLLSLHADIEDVMGKTRVLALVALALTSLAGCQHTRGAKPIMDGRAPGALGSAPVAGSLVIDVGVSDVRLVMGQPQQIVETNLGRRGGRDSISYVFETKPAECATPEVSPGRIGVGRRDRNCSVRWDIHIPRIADVRVRVSVGDVEVVAPVDRAIRLDADVGSVRIRLDGRELQRGKSPGSGDQVRLGDLDTTPRLDVRTGVGSIRAELTTKPGI